MDTAERSDCTAVISHVWEGPEKEELASLGSTRNIDTNHHPDLSEQERLWATVKKSYRRIEPADQKCASKADIEHFWNPNWQSSSKPIFDSETVTQKDFDKTLVANAGSDNNAATELSRIKPSETANPSFKPSDKPVHIHDPPSLSLAVPTKTPTGSHFPDVRSINVDTVTKDTVRFYVHYNAFPPSGTINCMAASDEKLAAIQSPLDVVSSPLFPRLTHQFASVEHAYESQTTVMTISRLSPGSHYTLMCLGQDADSRFPDWAMLNVRKTKIEVQTG